MKKIIKGLATGIMSSIMVSTMGIGVAGCDKNQKLEDPSTNPYDILGIGNIHIGMWVTPPGESGTQEAYDIMAESGINFVNGFEWFELDENRIRKALTYAGNSGLKFLVADRKVSGLIESYAKAPTPKTIQEIMDQIETYYSYPAYAGQLLKDEPNISMFNALNDVIREYNKNYPGKQWHINMFPSYGEGGAGAPYEQYVDDWMDLVNPNYYSYDSYPLLEVNEDNPFARYESEDYYYNLDILRTKTAERRIPLWSFIQTLAIGDSKGNYHKRVPSREDIRWQVFTNLAFGVKGLQYFCYWTPNSGSETFSPAMIAPDGSKTERYDHVKEVNEEVFKIGKSLLLSDSEGVILHTASTEKRFRLYKDSLTSFDCLERVSGDDVLIGCFFNRYTGEKSVMITPTTPRDDISITLSMKKGTKKVTSYSGLSQKELAVENGALTLNIAKGDSLYIVF